jgi:hypothetical protein
MGWYQDTREVLSSAMKILSKPFRNYQKRNFAVLKIDFIQM